LPPVSLIPAVILPPVSLTAILNAVVLRTLNRLGDSSVPFPNSPSTPDCIPAFYSFIQGASPTGRVLQKLHYVRVHCNENPSDVFPEKELRGFSPNFHVHVSVMRFIYSQDRLTCSRIGRPIVGIYISLTDT
jgi:hypothetical protein